MKPIFALAVIGLLAAAAPAFAQDAGAPGAAGTGGTLTGSNPGTSGPNATVHTRHYMSHAMMMRHHRMHRHAMMMKKHPTSGM